jgi:hypothetical protein
MHHRTEWLKIHEMHTAVVSPASVVKIGTEQEHPLSLIFIFLAYLSMKCSKILNICQRCLLHGFLKIKKINGTDVPIIVPIELCLIQNALAGHLNLSFLCYWVDCACTAHRYPLLAA